MIHFSTVRQGCRTLRTAEIGAINENLKIFGRLGVWSTIMELAYGPYGPQSAFHGFSHGLKTCHWHVFTPANAGAGLSNPCPFHKKYRGRSLGIFYGVDNGIRTHDLQSHNLTR